MLLLMCMAGHPHEMIYISMQWLHSTWALRKEQTMHSIISAVLKDQYGILAKQITQVQGGWSALAYQIKTQEQLYFLKIYQKKKATTHQWIRRIDDYMPIVVWLNEHTPLKDRMVSPILTHNSAYKHEDDNYLFMLFQHIDGYTLRDDPLTPNQVAQLAEITAHLHQYGKEIPLSTHQITEDYSLPFCEELEAAISTHYAGFPSDVSAILKEYEQMIAQRIERAQMRLQKLKKADLHYVLCHTDIHGFNLMQSNTLRLIDWEGLKLAPAEADLFSFEDEPYWDAFMQTYKKIRPHFTINPDLQSFFRVRRTLEDVHDFVDRILHDHLPEDERKRTMRYLQRELIRMD